MKDEYFHTRMRCRPGSIAAAVLVLACGSDATSVPPPEMNVRFRVVSGGGATDTIDARLLQALIVEIRDSTMQLARGKTVRFEALPADDPNRREPTILVKALDANQYTISGIDVTDSLGRAQMLVALGRVAGQARLGVYIPEFGRVDTVIYTVKPGKPSRLIVGTPDTTVQPGATYSLNTSVVDRYANPTPGESPTYAAGPGISVSANGLVTVGTAFAQGHVNITWQAVADTARVTVFEKLPLVGARAHQMVLRINTDGTAYTLIASSTHGSLSPHAVRTTSAVVYYQGDPLLDATVWIFTPGAAHRLLAGSPNGFVFAAWPRWSLDAKWVYFVGSRQAGLAHLWRIAPDGSQLDSLGTLTPSEIHVAPTISPDGTTAAIHDEQGLKLIDIATKSARIIGVPCWSPRYSPDGRRFACVTGGRLSVMNVDGTDSRTLSNPGVFHDLGAVDWSPDGNWLIANSLTAGPQLLNVNDGTILRLRNLGTGTFQLSFVR